MVDGAGLYVLVFAACNQCCLCWCLKEGLGTLSFKIEESGLTQVFLVVLNAFSYLCYLQ